MARPLKKDAKKRPNKRVQYKITDKNVARVEALAQRGVKKDHIRAVLGCDYETFERHFLQIYLRSRAEGASILVGSLFDLVFDTEKKIKDPSVILKMLSVLFDYKEKIGIEISTPEGFAIGWAGESSRKTIIIDAGLNKKKRIKEEKEEKTIIIDAGSMITHNE